jgi:hypothetical protein
VSSPIDTIREALTSARFEHAPAYHVAMAALTELEQQLAAVDEIREYGLKPAGLLALINEKSDALRRAEAAERRANDIGAVVEAVDSALTEVEQREAALVRRAEKAERRGDRNGNAANEQRNRAVAAEQRANDLEQRIAICPYCAHGFEKQEGRSYGACPGCERAHELQRQNDALGMIGAALTDDLDDMERRANDLADALRWYADRRNYVPAAPPATKPPEHLMATDAFDGEGPGARARAALDRHTHEDVT